MGELLKNKVAVVTGAGRGIGRAHAIALAAQGAKVVVNNPKRETADGVKSKADLVVDDIKAFGGEAVANYDSVSSSSGAAGIIKTALDAFGRLDILVNNAGVFRHKMIWLMSDEDWDEVIMVHLYGTFYCCREAIKIFKEQKSGRIINTSTAAALGTPGTCNYSAAKEGTVGLTRGLAHEMWRYGVTVNCIRPGAASKDNSGEVMLQRLLKRGISREEAERRVANNDKRTPEGCTAIVVFLASDAAENVNGCVFNVSAGQVSIYRDPPYIEGSIWKDGNFTPEELVEIIPRSLCLEKTRELPMRDIWPPL